MGDLSDLCNAIDEFNTERDWHQFHDPKSLILALTGEVGELAELFQWLPADRAGDAAGHGTLQQRTGEELADILIYLVQLADVCGINLMEAAQSKLAATARRYPVETFRGVAPTRS